MFKPNFTKAGPGVEKPTSTKPSILMFFELLKRKLWNLCKLNMLYMITSIPFFIVTMLVMGVLTGQITNSPTYVANLSGMTDNVSKILVWFDFTGRFVFAFLFTIFVGQGPVTAGYTYILRNYAREEHVYLISDFWDNIKSNFRQSICLWLIDLAAFSLFVIAFRFYASLTGPLSFIKYLIFAIGVIYLMMHLYVYQVMVTFDLPLKTVLKNSFIFAGLSVPRNLLLLLITLLIHAAVPYVFAAVYMNMPGLIIFCIVEFLILPSVSGFMNNFFVYPTLKRYIS